MTSVYCLIFYESSSIFIVAQPGYTTYSDPGVNSGDRNPRGGGVGFSSEGPRTVQVIVSVKNDALAAVLEEPMNISTNSAVICWNKPETNSAIKTYVLRLDEAKSGGIDGALLTLEIPSNNKNRFCQTVENLEEDTKYLYSVMAMHNNGLAVSNVDRQHFKTKANCK